MANSSFEVTVTYAATEDRQQLIKIQLPVGSTIADAIQQSQILTLNPEIDLTQNKIGIFGKLKSLTTLLSANDRVEIYRPLLIDPKEIRRLKAKKKLANNHLA